MVVFSTVPMRGVIDGSQATTQIDKALEDLRREETRLTESMSEITGRIAAARADETGALGDLARFRLQDGGAAIGERLDQASRDAARLMAARASTLAALQAEQTAKAAAVADHRTNLAALRADLEAIQKRIEALQDELATRLSDDAAHQELLRREDAAEATAKAADEKATQAEADRATKSASYEHDILFKYLWDRKFGTPEYAHGGLVRTLDRWVSNLIGFLEARPAYVLLNEIPLRLRTHATRLAEEAEKIAVEVDRSEDQALAVVAGEDIAQREDALNAGIQAQEEAMAPLERELAALDDRIAAFASGEDEQFRQATDALVRSIAGEDVRTLRLEAERTPSPDDERFVERLIRARDEVRRLEPDATRLRSEIAEISKRRQELLRIAQDVRSRGWNRRGHSFDFGDLLTGFMLGRVSGGSLWGRMQSTHRGGSTGGFGGGFGGSSGGFRTGGRIGGGGFRTGRSFGGGGGFRTGRKF